jgi:hypothetical protein
VPQKSTSIVVLMFMATFAGTSGNVKYVDNTEVFYFRPVSVMERWDYPEYTLRGRKIRKKAIDPEA